MSEFFARAAKSRQQGEIPSEKGKPRPSPGQQSSKASVAVACNSAIRGLLSHFAPGAHRRALQTTSLS